MNNFSERNAFTRQRAGLTRRGEIANSLQIRSDLPCEHFNEAGTKHAQGGSRVGHRLQSNRPEKFATAQQPTALAAPLLRYCAERGGLPNAS